MALAPADDCGIGGRVGASSPRRGDGAEGVAEGLRGYKARQLALKSLSWAFDGEKMLRLPILLSFMTEVCWNSDCLLTSARGVLGLCCGKQLRA